MITELLHIPKAIICYSVKMGIDDYDGDDDAWRLATIANGSGKGSVGCHHHPLVAESYFDVDTDSAW